MVLLKGYLLTLYALSDGINGKPEVAGGFVYGHTASGLAVLSHAPMLYPSKASRKALEAILAALSGVPLPYGPADGATGSYL